MTDILTIDKVVERYKQGERSFCSITLTQGERYTRQSALFGLDFSGSDFSRSDFSGVSLRYTIMKGCMFWSAKLRECDLKQVDFSFAVMENAELTKAYLRHADFSNAIMTGIKLNKAYLASATLSNATLCSAELLGADLSGADFSNANLSEADLSYADLRGAIFHGASLIEADLSKTLLFPNDGEQGITGYFTFSNHPDKNIDCVGAKINNVKGLSTKQLRLFHEQGAELGDSQLSWLMEHK